MDPQVLDILQQTVTWEAYVSEDEYTAPSYAAPVPIQAMVQYRQSVVKQPDGKEVMARVEILLNNVLSDGTTWTPGPQDRFTLPTGEQSPVLAIEGPVNEFGGTDFWRVFTG